MRTAFNKLNDGWNAEPNAPDPYVEVKGTDVILEFFVNPYQFKGFSEGQLGQLRFLGCRRYRMGPTNDEGWNQGQCRFSGLAPAWGEFYEVTGDLRLNECPDDWKYLAETPHPEPLRHFLFYFRDETFECDAAGYVLDLNPGSVQATARP